MKKEFEGTFWCAEIICSNRFSDCVEFTLGGSDKRFKVPESRAASTIKRLENGESPDEVAKSFPIEF